MIAAAQCRAARALIEWTRDQLAEASGVDTGQIADFEQQRDTATPEIRQALQRALEDGGAVFIPENGGGYGVRLKFTRREVGAINKWEGEGGSVGEDDV